MGFDTPGGGAPTDAPYLTSSSDPDLSNETVVNNPENVPTWTEDGNSPLSISGATSGSITLASSYKAVKVIVVDTGQNNEAMGMRVNGDTGANYDYVALDGTLTTGASQFDGVVTTQETDGQVMQLAGDWGANFNAFFGQPSTNNSRALSGENANITSPLDSIELRGAASNVDVTARVYGLS